MSTHCNDYIIASNNSINDNKVNAKKSRHQLKYLLKPLLALLKKHKKNTYKKNAQPDYFDETEINDNFANEILENKIFEEIDTCEDFSGVPIYCSDGHLDIIPIFRGQRYIPVNFARTQAGTFFWTSMVGPDCDIVSLGDKNAITEHQIPVIQAPCDRWAQA